MCSRRGNKVKRGDRMKVAIIYSSKSGFTEKYAQWIAQETTGDLIALRDLSEKCLNGYDKLVYGGGLYAGGVNGLKKFKALTAHLPKEKLIYFATGATPAREGVALELVNGNFSEGEREGLQFFYFRGGFDYSLLGIVDKLLMNVMKLMIRRKKASERTPDESGMLAAYDHPVDFCDFKQIEPLIACIRRENG